MRDLYMEASKGERGVNDVFWNFSLSSWIYVDVI